MSGDFSPFLTSTNMTYAPQFKTGTVFQPGTIKRDGAGNIIDGLPFVNNVVPQSLWQPLSANMLKIYTGIPGYANLPAAPNPGYVRYFYNNPSLSGRTRTCFAWTTRSAARSTRSSAG